LSEVLVQVEPAALRTEVGEALSACGLRWTLEPPDGRLGPVAVIARAPREVPALALMIAGLRGRWRIAPALVLVADEPRAVGLAEALGAGADEWLAWPERKQELGPRLAALLRRRSADLGLHPLTGLPGAPALLGALEEATSGRRPLAAVAFDLRHFKAFNDRYGFARGDCVLWFVANLLEVVAKNAANVYHVGGDDFCLVCAPEAAQALAMKAVEGFKAGVACYYDEADREAGGFSAPAREDGARCWYPLMSLTVTCVTVGQGSRAEDVARLLSSLRADAKINGPGFAAGGPIE
jgi:GGDEF domain-containing protein